LEKRFIQCRHFEDARLEHRLEGESLTDSDLGHGQYGSADQDPAHHLTELRPQGRPNPDLARALFPGCVFHSAIRTPHSAFGLLAAQCLDRIDARSPPSGYQRRRREAPIATRTAISVNRPAPLAKTKLATLAQATARTNPTVTSKNRSLLIVLPKVARRNGSTHTVDRPLVRG
jgi:hypothetical protein